MHHIPTKVDFYITNVCNLTCEGCNRFNNYDFRGWQRWSDYSEEYRRWSQLVSLKAATIMGGEPFLNPTLPDWVRGINQYFGIEVQVLTNGTRFLQARELYKELLYTSSKTKAPNHIGVSLHNADQAMTMDQEIRSFLQGPVEVFPKQHARNMFKSDYVYIDRNGIMVNVYMVNKFTNSTLRQVTVVNSTGTSKQFALHNSNPDKAHNNCAFATFKSYHFIRGKLYKCGPVALLPEFDQQHNIMMSDEDRAIMNSYRPLDPDNFEAYHQEFFENLDKPIPQCKFCPESYVFTTIKPVRKGLQDV
jgi:organic radical activating enzyme